MNKKTFNSYNEIEEDLLERAFDAEEDLPLPEDYILDEINDQAVDYLRRVGKEREASENKHSHYKAPIDFEFSLNVNNTDQFQMLYDKLRIKREWIEEIKYEFEVLKSQLDEHIQCHKQNTMNFDQILNKYKLHRDQFPFALPDDSIVCELAPVITNKICVKLITHFNKIFLDHFRNKDKSELKCIFLWIYFSLAMLKTPLVDDDNSILYDLNKNILNKGLKHDGVICTQESDENTSCKVVYTIISEIFGQKVIT